jgi:tetratricopeptide (TPR) repeat protein
MQTKMTLRYGWIVVSLLLASGCSRSAKSYLQSAKKYFDGGKYEDAIILYKKAIQKEPKSGEAYYRLALADLKLGKVPDAYQALSTASSLSTDNDEIQSAFADFCFEIYLIDPRHPKGLYDKVSKLSADLLAKSKNSYDGLRLKGYLAMADKKPKDAIDTLRQADQLRPMQPQVVFPLSKALIQDHQEQAAEKMALASIQKNKTFGPMYDLLFSLYSSSGRQTDAENILKAKVDNNPKQAPYVLNLAAFYQFQKRPDEVKKTLQQLTDHPKDYQHPHALVGDFYLAGRNVAAALSEYDQGIKSDPKDKAVYQKRIVNTLLLEGKKDEAKATIAELAKSQPQDEDVQMVQATMWIEGGKPAEADAAINLLKPLVEKKPGDANRRYRLGQAYQVKGRMQEAETEWRAAAKNDRAFLPARMALAELSLQTGRFPAALTFSEEILSRDPNNQGAHFLHALALINSSKTVDARTELNELLKAAPNSLIARLAMGRLELIEKHFPEAEKQFGDAYKVGQPDLRPLDGLVTVYVAQNQPAKAMALVEKELAAAPDRPDLIARHAELNVRTAKYAAGREEYQRLLAKDANSPQLNRRIGEISVVMGDKDAAIRSFQKALEADPKDMRSQVELGSLLLSSGKKPEALVIFRKALALSPEQPAILNNVAFLIADTGGDLKEALELARKGLEKDSKDLHLSDTVGFIYWKQHLNDSALQTFRTVVQKDPDNATYRLHLAKALLSQGDKTEAKTQLEAALLRNPPKDEESEIKTLLAGN